MAITPIQMPTQRARAQSTIEQIAMGVDAASKILGLGLNAYRVLGIEKPQAEADSAYKLAESNSLPTRYGFMKASDQDVSSGQARGLAGQPDDQQFVPKNVDQTNAIIDYRNQRLDQSAQMHAGVTANQEKKTQDQAFFKAKQDLEALRGNPGLQMAQKNLLFADNALSVIKPYENDLGNVPASQLALFHQEEAKMATGGVPTESELNKIGDHTLYKDLSALRSKIMNMPEGAGQAEFLPNHVRYLNDLKENSINLIQKSYQRKLNDWKSKLSSDDYSTLNQGMQDFLDAYRSNGIQTAPGQNGNAVIAPTTQMPEGKIHVSNPKTGEQFYIDPAHLNDAQQEGFQQIK